MKCSFCSVQYGNHSLEMETRTLVLTTLPGLWDLGTSHWTLFVSCFSIGTMGPFTLSSCYRPLPFAPRVAQKFAGDKVSKGPLKTSKRPGI